LDCELMPVVGESAGAFALAICRGQSGLSGSLARDDGRASVCG
jgi:hypothetical protein